MFKYTLLGLVIPDNSQKYLGLIINLTKRWEFKTKKKKDENLKKKVLNFNKKGPNESRDNLTIILVVIQHNKALWMIIIHGFWEGKKIWLKFKTFKSKKIKIWEFKTFLLPRGWTIDFIDAVKRSCFVVVRRMEKRCEKGSNPSIFVNYRELLSSTMYI